jgi:F-type H+-transporting ATPase subunit a
MPEHLHWFTILLNKWFGSLALALLSALHIHVEYPAYPIPNAVAGSFAVLVLAMIFFLWLRPRISVDNPGALQQMMEGLITNSQGLGIRDLLEDNIEHGADKYLAVVGSVSIFILLANAISSIPAFESPTQNPSVPLACAIVTFVYYNFAGLKTQGPVGYVKHFAGPVWWLAWLIFPVEIVSHTARLLSLTVRLWANIFASELIYMIFLSLLLEPTVAVSQHNAILGWGGLGIFAAILPGLFILLHLFVAVVQAFVFTILPAIYIGMATSHEH